MSTVNESPRALLVAFLVAFVAVAGGVAAISRQPDLPEDSVALGTTTSTTKVDRPFELAGSTDKSTVTTLFMPEGRPVPTTTTAPPPTTTTTLPGSNSPDGICSAMSDLYRVSRTVSVTAGTEVKDSVSAYGVSLGKLSQAVASSAATDIRPQQAALTALTSDIAQLLMTAPTESNLDDAYQRLTDPKSPPIAAMLGHLRTNCADLARTVEVGL